MGSSNQNLHRKQTIVLESLLLPGIAVLACNPNSLDKEKGKSLRVWEVWWVQVLPSEMQIKKKKGTV